MSNLMLICIIDDAHEDRILRTTITIDDELYRQALDVADPEMDKTDLFREAMKVFVRVQAGKRLARLGGKSPKMKSVPRRRPAEDSRR
jgi:Arc/MetJ family transcription regulator